MYRADIYFIYKSIYLKIDFWLKLTDGNIQ